MNWASSKRPEGDSGVLGERQKLIRAPSERPRKPFGRLRYDDGRPERRAAPFPAYNDAKTYRISNVLLLSQGAMGPRLLLGTWFREVFELGVVIRRTATKIGCYVQKP